jgi:hypothetical protein
VLLWPHSRSTNTRVIVAALAQCRDHEVHRIADQQGNSIAGLDAFLTQASGHSPSCGAQLAPGQRAIQVLDGRPIRGSIGVVQHRTEHAVVRHAFWQVMHARYSYSPIEGTETRRTYGSQATICAEATLTLGAPEGIRTPNLLIRSQMLYPLSYGRLCSIISYCVATRCARLRRAFDRHGWRRREDLNLRSPVRGTTH